MPDNLPAARKAQKPALTAQGALPDLGAVEADHFDGWALDDIKEQVLILSPGLSRAEKITEQYRRLVGLGLYRVLAEEGERAGADFIRQVVESSGVAARTVGNWRRVAMDAFSLPPPTARSRAHLDRPTARETREEPAPVPVESTDKTPPAGAPDRLPMDQVDPTELVDHAQDERFTKSDPPKLPLANPCPTCKGTGIAPTPPQPMIRRPSTKAERGPRFTRANCPHYPGARNGTYCMDCETEVYK